MANGFNIFNWGSREVGPEEGAKSWYQIPTQTPYQELARGGLLAKSLYDAMKPAPSFEPIRQRAIQEFQQNTIPDLAEKFAGSGGQRSSAFQQALGQAGANLNTQLAQLGSEHAMRGYEAQQQLLPKLLQQGLAPGYENVYQPVPRGAQYKDGELVQTAEAQPPQTLYNWATSKEGKKTIDGWKRSFKDWDTSIAPSLRNLGIYNWFFPEGSGRRKRVERKEFTRERMGQFRKETARRLAQRRKGRR